MEYRTWPEVLSDWNESIKEKASSTWEFVKQIPLALMLSTAAIGTAGFMLTNNYELNRDKEIPLAFSEKTQLEKEAAKENEKVAPLVKYQTSLNDSNMKIFERRNIAKSKKNTDFVKAFAKELWEERTGNKHNYSLHQLLVNLPEESNAALESMKQYFEVRSRIIPVNSFFESSWNERHIDNYHTEWYTTTSTDSEGHTKIETHSRQVYDDTDHYYDYFPQMGEAASSGVDALLSRYPNLKLNERIRRTTKINAENAKAMHTSRARELKDKVLSNVEMLTLGNKWLDGSTFMLFIPRINQHYNENLTADANSWRSAKQTARSVHYKTYSSHDDGPGEFQVARSALYNGRNIVNLLGQIEQGIVYTRDISPRLDDMITEFIKTSFGPESKEKSARAYKLSEDIMGIARQQYKLNFKEGFDVEGYRTWVVVLGTILGIGLGAGIGIGLTNLMGDNEYRGYGRYRRY
jgi:hypothetical protein